MKKTNISSDYKLFFGEIKERISKAQYEALKAVNKELIGLYWDIGKLIVGRQNRYGWGKSIVEKLSKDLQKEFAGIRGFSTSNLWRMKNFFATYCKREDLAPLVREMGSSKSIQIVKKCNGANLPPMVAEIGWAHNVIIMEKCKDNNEREFYLKMSKKFGWTKNILIHQIENKTYKKYLLNQTNFDSTLPSNYKNLAKLAVKDEYTFDFLEINEEHHEKELANKILNNIRRFLIEMGGYFAFIGSQYRIEIDGEEFFIDLLLYHRKLKSLIAVELKIDRFKPEYAGKMQFYLSALDDKIRLADENPSIGIIICKQKNRTIVEYTLRDSKKPIGIATYRITNKLPSKMKKMLPSPKEIADKLYYLG